MKKNKIYELGKTLEITDTEAKAAILKNRNKIVTGIVIGLAAIIGKMWFQPSHYTGISIDDFDFLTRLL
jgi:predicted secreted protein